MRPTSTARTVSGSATRTSARASSSSASGATGSATSPAPRAAIGSLSALEDDERDLAVRALLVVGVAAVGPHGLRPQALALLRVRHPGMHAPLLMADLDRRVGVRAQVVEPCRALGMAALRGDEDDVVAVGDVHQRRGAPRAALRADVVEQQHRRGAPEAGP